jgi:hypothetical protein
MISTIASTSLQEDGRAYVTESHTDQFGIDHHVEYLSEKTDDRAAILSEHAEQLAASLVQTELEHWLSVVESGEPIPVDGCKYVARNQAFAYCFQTLCFSPDVSRFYKIAWVVPYFTDTEFVDMGFSMAQIAQIRTNAVTLINANTLLTSVTPLES